MTGAVACAIVDLGRFTCFSPTRSNTFTALRRLGSNALRLDQASIIAIVALSIITQQNSLGSVGMLLPFLSLCFPRCKKKSAWVQITRRRGRYLAFGW
jgi:hypothetical protein